MDDINEFDQVTSQLGNAYRKMKEAEKEKNRLRDELFRMIDNAVGNNESFEYVNRSDGFVYSRQVSTAAPQLDDERLQAEDPELWDEITFVPEPERTLRPLEDLSAEQLARIGNYLIKGKSISKLAAPRKAKPEELAK